MIKRISAALAATALVAFPAWSGQIRIDVGSNFFSPANVTVNTGDHVVFVWVGLGHSATSGNPATQQQNGLFNSNILSTAGSAFSWKSTQTTQYFCIPHAPGMAGSITAGASGAQRSSFRITEVQFNAANGQDFVEITNLGNAAGDLGRYRLSVRAGTPLTLAVSNINVPMGGRVVVWLNRAGTNTATDIFFASEPELPRVGSAALYAPNTVNTALTLADKMIDFVQWGAVDQLNASTAVSAVLWNGSESVPPPAAPHSIEFCGNETNRGLSFWNARPAATPGSADCVTPTVPSSWGRLKALYR